MLLLRRPSIRGAESQGRLAGSGESTSDAARRLVSGLNTSYLAIQGPPGTGKTRLAAKMIVDLLEAGRRVGITATSHKVISHLLDAVCEESARRDYSLRAIQKAEDDQRCASEVVRSTESNADVDDALAAAEVDLVAGTAWLFAREEIEGKLNYVFVDEAGQMSLANAIAVSTSAANIVLLGDPNQLSQPSKGSHPDGADLSGLDHVLDGSQTISDERGLFLGVSWRMHPDVCSFISEVAYESRLESAPECSRHLVGGEGPFSGTGLRYIPVEHSGNRTSSVEEAAAAAVAYGALLGRAWTDREGKQRPLTAQDILVVSPYNAQVALLTNRLPRGARVGTVDKFQGQEAPAVIYSMATSSAAEAPRGMDFLYSLNRLNVAISRAQGLAILICSPALLDVKAHTPEQMRLANAVCRLVEVALAKPLSARTSPLSG
jgi:superfamily I DNA and/or RNA helicase